MSPNQQHLHLDDDQRFALMKFRRSVSDITKPHHDDYFLARWLRARSWDAEAAEHMLRESMKWRECWEIDTGLLTWEKPEALKKFHPSGMSGYDKDGCPVIIVPFIGLDLYGLLHAVSKADMIKITIRHLEDYLKKAADTKAHQVVAIIDLEGFCLRDYAWRPTSELVISLIKMYEANYPEILRACYIINAPKVFAFAWSIVKNFMNEYTISKIYIYKADPKKWQPALLERIPPDQLPAFYGGIQVDPDGDPRCPSVIKLGGKVPKSYYTLKTENENNNEYQSAIVRKGEKLQLDFICAEKGSFLKWEFRSEGHDIKFGIVYYDEEGKENVVVHPHRVASHQINEVGIIACQAPATYAVVFDNTYSYMRNKKVFYSVELVPPINQEKTTLLPEDELSLSTDTAIATTSN